MRSLLIISIFCSLPLLASACESGEGNSGTEGSGSSSNGTGGTGAGGGGSGAATTGGGGGTPSGGQPTGGGLSGGPSSGGRSPSGGSSAGGRASGGSVSGGEGGGGGTSPGTGGASSDPDFWPDWVQSCTPVVDKCPTYQEYTEDKEAHYRAVFCAYAGEAELEEYSAIGVSCYFFEAGSDYTQEQLEYSQEHYGCSGDPDDSVPGCYPCFQRRAESYLCNL